ncbi:MAG: hypothetical protein WAW73_02775 [Rhodoferax sp.]
MIKFLQRLALVLLLAALSACVSNPSMSAGADYFPGGSKFYSYGVVQSKENFVNVERAQSNYGMYSKQRSWLDIRAERAPGSINMLQAYYPLHVRWKLKDGREFILESIDIRAIMREYFKTHDIRLQWQREGRQRDPIGDYNPSLVHEVKDDTVIIKWFLRINGTPVGRRLAADGAATHWDIRDEQFIVTTLKGNPTSGIDFERWVEILK